MNNEKGKLPDFIVCGFQKCATSALSRTLSQHSKLSIARTDDESAKFCKGKELNFFAKSGRSTFYRGIDWYKSHFIDDGNLWGECSPNYSMWNQWFAIEQFKVHLGDNTKFIFSIRNPIYRTFSAFNHYIQVANDSSKPQWNSPGSDPNKNFMWNLENSENKFYVSYIKILKMYENEFGKNNVHIIIQEKLDSSNYQSEYDKIFSFLNLESEHINNIRVHKRDYESEIKDEEVSFLKEYAEKDVNELFDWLGYEIKEWTEFC